MKKLITLALIVGATTLTQAQSNLVFNQVLNFKVSISVSATVPEGKVWKVEHNNSGDLLVDKVDVAYGSPLNNDSFVGTSEGHNAIWFSEGAVLKTNSGSVNLSILEFNVVPTSTTIGGSGGLSSEGLEFNQVINYSTTSTVAGYGQIVDVLEIPQGKVWKITRVTILKVSGLNPYIPLAIDEISVELGGINLFYRPSASGYSNSSYENYPVWINSGTKDLAVGDTSSSSSSIKITLSAIEYNIPQ